MNWFYHRRYPQVLLGLLCFFIVLSAINPLFPSDFILESVLSVLFVLGLVCTYRVFPLSHLSYTLIFVFLTLHTIGAHYTYAEVPFGFWLQNFFELSRNHYDRIVHFSFGLLLAYPVREVFLRIATVRGFWGYYLPLDVMASLSMFYELIEWGAALFFGGDLGTAYLGTQGDEWDAQKDMALATLGGFVTMCVTTVVNYCYKKNFGADIGRSLRVKRRTPLGEVELRRMRK